MPNAREYQRFKICYSFRNALTYFTKRSAYKSHSKRRSQDNLYISAQMVRFIGIIYCLVATFALPGLAASIGNILSGLDDLMVKVNALDTDAVQTTGSDLVTDAGV